MWLIVITGTTKGARMRIFEHAGITIGMMAALSCIALKPATAESTWHVERTIEVGGEGGMDYLSGHQVSNALDITFPWQCRPLVYRVGAVHAGPHDE
jgi:hypothetical protein